MKLPGLAALLTLATAATLLADNAQLHLTDLRIRDPFILPDPATKTYYLYAQTGNRHPDPAPGLGVDVYTSTDLAHWHPATLAFRKPASHWGGNEIWAPEVHRFGDAYYLFVTLNGRIGKRGTQIFRAPSPAGPFEVFSDLATTPADQRALDGTPFIDTDGTHYLVYCHEWAQITDGGMLALAMKPDWSAPLTPETKPLTLFHASSAPWVVPLKNNKYAPDIEGLITDGPCFYRTKNGTLLMLWSSFGQDGYAIGLARSESGQLAGPWTQSPEPFFKENGGHCMIFRTFEGQLKLALHQPNSSPNERPRLFNLLEENNTLRME